MSSKRSYRIDAKQSNSESMSVGGTGFKTPNIPQMFIYVEVGGQRRKEQMFNFIVMRFQPFLNTPSNVYWSVVILKELSFSREDSLDKRIEFIGPECSDTDRLLSTHAREQIDQEDALRYQSPDHKGTAAVLHSSQQNWKEGISGLSPHTSEANCLKEDEYEFTHTRTHTHTQTHTRTRTHCRLSRWVNFDFLLTLLTPSCHLS
ncbi:hypothetical protein AVEN_23940-1 [Araneus ventricosus]|uniref:Uncharacterized protein n=1 Tax=Araneus ventricosus TaxID=182803 RepID=A0A4Y2U6Q3_ARAVE|nr:hypothetical protein AVEN_23940-1 [Araneus ventricosus]